MVFCDCFNKKWDYLVKDYYDNIYFANGFKGKVKDYCYEARNTCLIKFNDSLFIPLNWNDGIVLDLKSKNYVFIEDIEKRIK